MRVSEAYAAAGITPRVDDSAFRVTCDDCATAQSLDKMALSEVGGVSIYACQECGKSLVGVKPFKEDAQSREGSGHRLQSNVIGSKVDLFMDVESGDAAVLLSATPAFFE